MNPENINLKAYPIPSGYRLANADDMKRKHTSGDWMFFWSDRWVRCNGWLTQKDWTYLVPINKRKASK